MSAKILEPLNESLIDLIIQRVIIALIRNYDVCRQNERVLDLFSYSFSAIFVDLENPGAREILIETEVSLLEACLTAGWNHYRTDVFRDAIIKEIRTINASLADEMIELINDISFQQEKNDIILKRCGKVYELIIAEHTKSNSTLEEWCW
jgi:hypothetical protein